MITGLGQVTTQIPSYPDHWGEYPPSVLTNVDNVSSHSPQRLILNGRLLNDDRDE